MRWCLLLVLLATLGVSCGGSDSPDNAATTSASVAQDKCRIAFYSDRDGNDARYVMDADGSNQAPLTDATIDVFLDETELLSEGISLNVGKIVFTEGYDADSEIYVRNVDGSSLTRLTNNSVFDGEPAWSPDGKRIVFSSGHDTTSAAFDRWVYVDEIYVINPDGSNLTRLIDNGDQVDDNRPAWTPDGTKILFHSDRDEFQKYQTYIMDADGANQLPFVEALPGLAKVEPLPPQPWYIRNWFPDDSKIVFTAKAGDQSLENYVMDADGSNLTLILDNPSFIMGLSWSPDGSKIAVTGTVGDQPLGIYVMDADGTIKTRITTFSLESPSWSPGGSKIAFSAAEREDSSPNIYVIDADGSNHVRLTFDAGSDTAPFWSTACGVTDDGLEVVSSAALPTVTPRPRATPTPTPEPVVTSTPGGRLGYIPTPFVRPSATPTPSSYSDSPDTTATTSQEVLELTTTPSGLKYRDLVAGTGEEAKIGATAVVHYTGWLEDGTKFDSSVDRGETFDFVIGQGRVIKGWEEGVVSMKVGGKRELIIPPDLAYGDRGAGSVIPPGATLKFEVELISLR